MPQTLPTARFAAAALPPRARFEAWRHLLASVFEPNLDPDYVGRELRAEAKAVHIGNALVVDVKAESQGFVRSPRLVAAEGVDHYLVQIYRDGVCDGTYGDVQNTVHPGDIKIIDLARPFHTFNTDFDNVTLTLPRAVLAPLLDRPDAQHGRVLSRQTPLARILRSHILALSASAGELGHDDGIAMAANTMQLVATCLGGTPRRLDESLPYRAAIASQTVRDFIDRNLGVADLGPDMLARRFNMSRAHLYRLFAEEGGVAAYIQTRRLYRCYLAITAPESVTRAIGEIALSCGFSSEAHFSRAFRRAFGMSPSDARAGARALGAAEPSSPTSFLGDWIRGLRPHFNESAGFR